MTAEDWQLTILEILRGDEVWAMVQDANQFNDPPGEGMEYVAAMVSVCYIGTDDESEQIDSFSFKSTGSAGVLYDQPSVVRE